jgi:hypothetical protein
LFGTVGLVQSFDLQTQTAEWADSIRERGGSEDCVAAVTKGFEAVASLDGELKKQNPQTENDLEACKAEVDKAREKLGDKEDSYWSFGICKELGKSNDQRLCDGAVISAMIQVLDENNLRAKPDCHEGGTKLSFAR